MVNSRRPTIITAAAIAITAILATMIIPVTTKAQPTITTLPSLPQSGHLPVTTVQDENHIVTTVTKSGNAPTGPIIIIPPAEGTGDNGTILTPGENVSSGVPENITIISPGGNITEVPGNITNIGNDTVIIAPPDRNITETPGNVTIIDPPTATTLPVIPGTTPANNCTCNQPIPPVMVTPAPGQNITTGEQPQGNQSTTTPSTPAFPPHIQQLPTNTPPQIQQLPVLPGPTNPASNPGSNETQTNPSNNSTNSTTPVSSSSPFFPGLHVSSINYNGVNDQWLRK